MINDTETSIIGVILAGGEGRRMNYQNKGLVTLSGKPLVEHVFARLKPQVDKIYISANDDITCYEALGVPVITDDPCYKGMGPLAGIASVIRHLPEDAIVQIVSCDGPFIPETLVNDLRYALVEMHSIDDTNTNTNGNGNGKVVKAVYPVTSERAHYLYLQAVVEDLRVVEVVLASQDLRIRALLQALSAEPVMFMDERAFANCNQPEDIVSLEANVAD